MFRVTKFTNQDYEARKYYSKTQQKSSFTSAGKVIIYHIGEVVFDSLPFISTGSIHVLNNGSLTLQGPSNFKDGAVVINGTLSMTGNVNHQLENVRVSGNGSLVMNTGNNGVVTYGNTAQISVNNFGMKKERDGV